MLSSLFSWMFPKIYMSIEPVTTAALIGAGGAIGSSLLGGLFGGGDGGESRPIVPIPEYYEDPLFRPSAERVDVFTQNILEGKLPDFFAPIGEIGGEEFESALGLTQRDIRRGVTEDFARRGVSGAFVGPAVAESLADTTRLARFSELQRGLEARERLLGVGLTGQQSTAATGLAATQSRNQFEIDRTKLMLQALGLEADIASQEAAATGSTIGGLFSTGLDLFGKIAPSFSGASSLGSIGSLGSSTGGGGALFGGQDFSLSTSPLLAGI